MKLKQLFTILYILFFGFFGQAHNDKYRLILTNEPSTTITVAWNQVSGENPTVYYDTTDKGTNHKLYEFSQAVDKTVNFRGMSNRFVTLSNLSPNTNYYFVINDSESTSQRFWFRTAPDDNSRLFFIAGGDSRNNRVPRQAANTLVSKLKPHAIFFGGDMTDTDSDSEWQDWFDDWQLTIAEDGRMFPIVPARGNHESTVSIYNLFNTPNSDSYYAMTWGNNLIRVYTLNSEISVLGDQLSWLESDLGESSNITWKMAQYHKPMRPHTNSKADGNTQYAAWAQLFYDQQVRLVVDCDSHVVKTTWPVKPSYEVGNVDGFITDQVNGTVYTGEGGWGAPLRNNNDDKIWTRNSGSFNQFKLVFIDQQKIELRTINVDNANSVSEGSNDDPFTLPTNLNVFSPPTGSVVTISNSVDNDCPIAGTPCDDGDSNTFYDEEDGFCNCIGLPSDQLTSQETSVSSSSDDAEEKVNSEDNSGEMDLTSSDLELVRDGDRQLVGLRFQNVTFPEGSSLKGAYIQFQTDETSEDSTNVTIHGELTAASVTFEDEIYNISTRTKTSASVNWEIDEWKTVGEADLDQRTPNLIDIVNEIVSQDGWTTGNAMTFIISGTGRRVAESFNGTAAPILKLDFQICNPEGTICDDGNSTTLYDEEDGSCNCIGLSLDELTVQETKVSSSSDDAEENQENQVDLTSSDLELIDDSGNQLVGVRFNNVTFPEGANLYRAYIQFQTDEVNHTGDTSLEIHGELAAASVTFTNENSNISDRTKTDISVNWNELNSWETEGEAGLDQRTPNLIDIVNEIVSQDGWTSGNAITFIISGSGKRVAESSDGSSTPILKLFYRNTCAPIGTTCDDGDSNTFFDVQDGNCNCSGIPETGTLTYEVNSTNNDAEENASNDNINLISSDLELVDDGSVNQYVGIRFTGIHLPAGANITKAYIQFTVDDVNSGSTNLEIKVEASANSLEFSSIDGNISSRTTLDTINWNSVPEWDNQGDAGSKQQTPDISSLVKGVLELPEWGLLQPMTFIITGSGEREAESFNGNAAPKLIIEYSLGSFRWTGNTDTDWSNSENWESSKVPDSDANIITIPSGLDTYPTILEDINVGHISIESGATLISKSTIDGIVTYQRNLENGAQWYLMASPVVNETYNDDWISANEIASGQGDNRAVSIYDNSSLDANTGHWQYYQAGGSETTFNSAQGYGILKSTAGTVSFTGAGIYSETQTFNLIQSDSDNTSSTSNNYNLVGNPFTAYLNLGDFFSVNKDSIIVGASAYFWNGDTSSYETKLSGLHFTYEIAPGQGFFVEATANNASLTFDINDISHLADTSKSSDTFQRTTSARPEITLNLSDGNNNRYLKVFYIDGTTQGYDPGFDGRSFGGVSNTLTIFSDLVESDGNKYQIQSLPNQEHETMVIPIGVIADAGKEITFTAEALNLPNDLKVYVEDRENSIFTRLDEVNTNYTITLDNDLNGIGRFYLHSTSSVLNTDDIELQGISIYTKDKNTLCIYGIHSTQATISIYSILGKNVVNKSFNSKGVTDIKLPNLKRGIYIIHIATEKGKITKKILLH